MTTQTYSPGLEGVIAGETEICCVDQGVLLYRGYPIEQLSQTCRFEEIAYLLLLGELPDAMQLDAFTKQLDDMRKLPGEVINAIRLIPRQAPMMDVLRTGVSMAGHFDRNPGNSLEPLQQQAMQLLATCSQVLAARFRLLNGKEPVAPKPGLSHAAQILYQCHGELPEKTAERLLDLTLTLYAEHDFNASTFTCRVVCSTVSDMYSAVTAAIGSLKGPLHGGANEKAMEMIARFKSADEASRWVREALAKKEKVMGFGHRVYKHGDHRARILEDEMRTLAKQVNREDLVAIYDAIKDPIVNKERPIYPNVDYPCGLTYYLLGLPLDLYTPLFVCSRVSGWCAHFIEQALNNRLYRPLSEYKGPAKRDVPPMEKR